MSRAKSDFVDWASCLHPFGEDPYGPALPHDPVCAAIREARREDDPGLPQGVWERELKRADWDKALSLSLGVLRERSKDMQVAGWACEAALMRYGFASLPGGLRMIAGLCSGFGDGLHPQPGRKRSGGTGWRGWHGLTPPLPSGPPLCPSRKPLRTSLPPPMRTGWRWSTASASRTATARTAWLAMPGVC